MTVIRPYGDTTGDGRVQLSFTLPVPFGDATQRARAEGAALQLAAKMGLDPAMVVHAKGMGPDFTYFIVYGRSSHLVDLSQVTVAEREFDLLPAAEVNLRIRSALGRKLVVLGACIGTDAHTVGIDAILNVKGHSGEKGLEYYREMRVVNLGAQVLVPELVSRARAEHADAVLVSQVVTQKDAHLSNARELSAAFRAAYTSGTDRAGPAGLAGLAGLAGTALAASSAVAAGTAVAASSAGDARPVLVVGGPRFDPGMAGDLGVDKVFGRGTTPGEVASYLVHALAPLPTGTGNGAGG
jgi:beta-lysine 5,6-aminomutase beta subunit